MPNIFLCLMHQQDSGRWPWENRARVCAHSAPPVGDTVSADSSLGCVWHPQYLTGKHRKKAMMMVRVLK